MKVLIILLLSYFANAQNQTVQTFGEAKAKLRSIYGNKNETFYCRCPYQKNSIKSICKLNIKRFKKRQKRLEWEHVVPAYAFGQSFLSWRKHKTICPATKNKKGKFKFKGSRKCAHKKDKIFRLMEADLYNLVPSVGAINALRSNYSFVNKASPQIAPLCSEGPIISSRKIQPPEVRKGDIARVYLYMDISYPNRGIISKKNNEMFKTWSLNDPVTKEECSLYKQKKAIQKNINPILESPCLKF